jgi:hypothetical protein
VRLFASGELMGSLQEIMGKGRNPAEHPTDLPFIFTLEALNLISLLENGQHIAYHWLAGCGGVISGITIPQL